MPSVTASDLVSLETLTGWVWGDLDPRSSRGVRATPSVSQVLMSSGCVLGVRVTVEAKEEEREYQLKRNLKFPSHTDKADQEGRTYDQLMEMLAQLAPRLFELDPRRGDPFDHPFPGCPLFDPREVSGRLTQLVEVAQRDWVWQVPLPLDPTSVLARRVGTCAVCGQRVYARRFRDPVFWAGGNAGFVHKGCWPVEIVRF